MHYTCQIESKIALAIANSNEYFKRTVSIEAETVIDAMTKMTHEVSEEKIPNIYLPLTITIEEENPETSGV